MTGFSLRIYFTTLVKWGIPFLVLNIDGLNMKLEQQALSSLFLNVFYLVSFTHFKANADQGWRKSMGIIMRVKTVLKKYP